MSNYTRAQLVCKQLTLRNHLNLYEIVTSSFHGYYEVRHDHAQRQFVYFIVAICRNTLKSFLSQFLYGKAIWNFAQLLQPKIHSKYQKITDLSLRRLCKSEFEENTQEMQKHHIVCIVTDFWNNVVATLFKPPVLNDYLL